ncbi:MAG: hypothetical protein R6U22_03620 [Desulfohalobiaceae bacterium]
MQKILLSQGRPGMVLAKPVTRDNGMVLIAQGTELSEGIIRRLEGMGVQQVVVEGNPLSEEQGGAGLQEKLHRLDSMFRRHSQDAWMMEVKSFLQEYYRLRLAGQGSGQEG